MEKKETASENDFVSDVKHQNEKIHDYVKVDEIDEHKWLVDFNGINDFRIATRLRHIDGIFERLKNKNG